MKSSAAESLQTFAVPSVPVELIDPNPENPRKTFDEEALAELVESVKREGVKVPVKVRPVGSRYQLVYGERRLRAAKEAGLERIPAIVEELSDEATFGEAMIENAKRASLNPLDEGEAFKMWMTKYGLSAESIAERMGMKLGSVYARMKLAELTGPARRLVAEGQLDATIGTLIARLPTPELQADAFEKLEEAAEFGHDGHGVDELTFREAKDVLDEFFSLKLKDAPFKLDDADLVPACGACNVCPKRTGANPELFKDVKGDTCLDAECFGEKKKAHAEKVAVTVAEKSLAKGLEVLPPDESAKALKSSKYVKLDEQNHRDPKGRTYGELLGKRVEPVIAVDGEGKAHQLVPVEVAAEALKKDGKGKLAPQPPAAAKDWQAEYEERQKRDQIERDRRNGITGNVIVGVMEDVEKTKLGAGYLRELIENIASQPGFHEAQNIAERRGFKKVAELLKYTERCSVEKLMSILFELSLGRAPWATYGGFDARWADVCKRRGFDLVKLEKDVIATEKKAAEEKAAAEKAEAEKKAATEAAKKAKAEEKKPEPKESKKAEPGVTATGKKRRMPVEDA